MKHLLLNRRYFKIASVIFTIVLFISCSKQEVRSNNPNNTLNKKSDSTLSNKFTLTDNQKKVLDGAKKCLEVKFSYDKTMGYYVLTYKDGVNTGKKVFPGR